ncbi:hypothetical protein, partial [Paracoccus aminovorans]|uniref:hypothetical protein n=1 Tax=Paracoccus aminovorans TaxID=34004 RepID=UPI0039EB415E
SRARPPIIIEGTMDPTPGRWGPFWTPITPEAGSLLQAVQQLLLLLRLSFDRVVRATIEEVEH